ncbi:response regulator transcription factor [Pseudorhodoferax sp. Leaf274]|uniref:response regulator transcription factor n=1 Tax=Pseudorhodoferax sp. Leaf274 TaxID=1736318 RepID=UPI00138F82D0|nr:response regulator transcription factor [Pseudorhodoferax sp. Leaf274]
MTEPLAACGVRRLLVIDDHALVRMGVRTLVMQQFSACYDVDEAGTLEQGLARLATAQGTIALVLLDLQLPDAKGFAGLRILRRDHPGVPVVVLSGAQDLRIREEAMRLGARAYISKSADAGAMDAWVEVLRQHAEPQAAASAQAPGSAAVRTAQGLGLSPRQVQVLELLLAGLDNQAIALETGLTLGTVKNCVSSIFLGFNVRSRAELLGMFPT